MEIKPCVGCGTRIWHHGTKPPICCNCANDPAPIIHALSTQLAAYENTLSNPPRPSITLQKAKDWLENVDEGDCNCEVGEGYHVLSCPVTSIALVKRLIKALERREKMERKATRFTADGNKGGDYITITVMDDGLLHLEVGHCCVVMADHIVPVEFLTSMVATILRQHDGDLAKVVRSVGWATEYAEQLATKIHPVRCSSSSEL